MEKQCSMLSNTSTSKLMSLSLHPTTGEQQINASFLSWTSNNKNHSIAIIVHFWCKWKGHNLGKWTCIKNLFSMLCNTVTWKWIALPCHPLSGDYVIFPSHLQPQTTKSTALVSLFTLAKVKKTQAQKGTCMKKPFSMFCHTGTSKPMPYPYHPLTCNYIMLLSHLQPQTTKTQHWCHFCLWCK